MRSSLLSSVSFVLSFLCLSGGLVSCKSAFDSAPAQDFSTLSQGSPSIAGKTAYLASPFVTAGDRVYLVGHQNGSFPELGWHIKGEMGGIWDHPIKLMDGFQVDLRWDEAVRHLDSARSFVSYPYANQHLFTFPDQQLEVERWQFVPDHKEGLVVQLILHNTSDIPQKLTLHFQGAVDLRPTWLGERTNMIDGADQATFLPEQDAWSVKDSLNPWFVLFGADKASVKQAVHPAPASGLGIAPSLEYAINLPPLGKEILHFTIAGSYVGSTEAQATFADIQAHYLIDFQAKKERYAQLAARSRLTIPDPQLQQTFEWLKYNADWLIRTVPEIGTGIMAGIPDYPWWFGCDSEYALKGYMAVGQDAVVYQTIALLDSISEAVNGNGRIVHEVSSNGAVFNPGNINETPQFASLIWEVYRWNGDRTFLERYFPTIEKGLNWLLAENDANHNLLPEGFGMMEIHGLDSEMIDVASYTQRGFADGANLAAALGRKTLAREYDTIAAELKTRINKEFWSEEFSSYADFIGTDQQALRLIADAIERAEGLDKPWAVAELKATEQSIRRHPQAGTRPFVLHHNWVVNTPMEMGIAAPEQARKALETATRFVNPFGMFVTGIDRDESAGTDEGSFQGTQAFSYTGAVMTLPTGVQAIAENNYGRPDQALDYLKRMSRSFSYALPGSMYEVSPDYGMITQAWNLYSFAVPIVQQFFGIQPNAAQKILLVQPQMPSEWHEAALENVKIGENEVSIFYRRANGETTIKVVQTHPDWTILLQLPDTETLEIVAGAADPDYPSRIRSVGKRVEVILR